MANITIDLSSSVKPMKPMHAGGQPPVISSAKPTHFHYLTEAGIPYSRLHDVGGSFGGGKYVDIPNIFRNFDADETDPANYDFDFTDVLITGLIEAGVEPYFRLGITIENAVKVKPYFVFPPKDYEKWARICEHIIRHYTEGWADGYHYKITYWEIWNEPDNGQMWNGTPEDYYRLYHVAASHLKSQFPHLKIGGYGSCGFYAIANGGNPWSTKPPEADMHWVNYFHGFMRYIKEHNSPIDFFSWHSYAPVKHTRIMDAWLHEQMVAYGYGDLPTHLNEWDPYANELGTGHHGAEIAATTIAMQHGHVDLCCIYDMRISDAPYCPLFNPITQKPIQGYYSLVAFNTLYRLGTQVKTDCDTEELYVLAASDGKRHAMMISNLTGTAQELTIEGADLSDARFYVIDNERLLSWAPNAKALNNNSVLLIEW
ncbi:MAG: hypothetical protein IJW99_05970 [Clostridia bacterium]|nr:hypothetical protein [Clostridia bacterium]